jgi:hypothetical protein
MCDFSFFIEHITLKIDKSFLVEFDSRQNFYMHIHSFTGNHCFFESLKLKLKNTWMQKLALNSQESFKNIKNVWATKLAAEVLKASQITQ